MSRFLKICWFTFVLGAVPILPSLGSETMEKLPTGSIESTTGSAGPHILEGTLLALDGDFWVVEDMAGNRHRIHIVADTTLPKIPKQQGDSIQAVIRTGGHASFIQ